MKRLMVVLAICGPLVIAPGFVQAAVGSGTWTLSGSDAGLWQETFDGGGPGQPGNELWGAGLGYSFSGATLQSVVPGNSPYDYQTTYAGGTLSLTSAGPWGGDATIALDTITNNSFYDGQGALNFDLNGTDATGHWTIAASFSPTEPGYGYGGDEYGHTGVFGGSVTVAHTTPEPASVIVWSLLGGLGISVGWWRRRRKAK